ncbi:MAG TPA: hypothetical protein VFW33_11455 [Gemmataceae bacterium]|nr:hypothetical protein [Gemmataceae bacterium]
MPTDKVTETLLEAIKRGLARPGEHRLYKSGKLDGLFPGRAGAEAAARAMREGLIETTRTETKGKTVIDWVRVTPKAVEFVHDHESPLRALQELREELQATRDRVPAWSEEARRTLAALGDRLADDSARMLQRVEALSARVEEALRRLELLGPQVPEAVAKAVPWADEALAYLEKRRGGGAAAPCPLPELFAVMAGRENGLTVAAFHDGLRRLHERRLVRLLSPAAANGEMAQPEYALFDGGNVFYYLTL